MPHFSFQPDASSPRRRSAHLGEGLHLGEDLRLGKPEAQNFPVSVSPRPGLLRLGEGLCLG